MYESQCRIKHLQLIFCLQSTIHEVRHQFYKTNLCKKKSRMISRKLCFTAVVKFCKWTHPQQRYGNDWFDEFLCGIQYDIRLWTWRRQHHIIRSVMVTSYFLSCNCNISIDFRRRRNSRLISLVHLIVAGDSRSFSSSEFHVDIEWNASAAEKRQLHPEDEATSRKSSWSGVFQGHHSSNASQKLQCNFWMFALLQTDRRSTSTKESSKLKNLTRLSIS